MLGAIASDHVNSPRNLGPLPNATHIGKFGVKGDGPYMILYFVVQGGVIAEAAYESNGCPSSIACASIAVELLRHRTVAQANLLAPSDLALIAGGLPEGKGWCADAAVQAIQDAKLGSEENNG